MRLARFLRRAVTPPLVLRQLPNLQAARELAVQIREDFPDPKPSVRHCTRLVLRWNEIDARNRRAERRRRR